MIGHLGSINIDKLSAREDLTKDGLIQPSLYLTLNLSLLSIGRINLAAAYVKEP